MSLYENRQDFVSKYPPKSGHPLEGSIAFIVDRAWRDDTPVFVKHVAQRLMSVSLDRRVTLANLEAEITRVAVQRGAAVELG